MRKRSRTNWKRIDSMGDAEIEYADNPELDKQFFTEAVL